MSLLPIAAIAALALSRFVKNKVSKAENEVRKTETINDKYYLFIREGERKDLFVNHYNSQDFQGKLLRIKSVIEAYNGKNIIPNTTSDGTMIFFNMPGSSVLPLEKELQKYGSDISLGLATKI